MFKYNLCKAISPEHIIVLTLKVKMDTLEQQRLSHKIIRRERKRKSQEREKIRVKERGDYKSRRGKYKREMDLGCWKV